MDECKPLHEGATVGGVVGLKSFRYHLFGPPLEAGAYTRPLLSST